MLKTKIEQRNTNKKHLPIRERIQKTKTIIKSFPPTRIAPSGAGSWQYRPVQPEVHLHWKWWLSLKFIHSAPFWQSPGYSHSSSSIHWVAPSLLCPSGQLEIIRKLRCYEAKKVIWQNKMLTRRYCEDNNECMHTGLQMILYKHNNVVYMHKMDYGRGPWY